jgi:hypothetical protein
MQRQNRDLLTGTIRLVAIPVAAAILVIGWFGIKELQRFEGQLRSSAEQQLKTETVRMQSEIERQLDQQFQTTAVQKTVRDAARDATQTAAAPLIKAEVTHEVQAHIRAEGPQIHAAVISETKKGGFGTSATN